MDKFPFSMSYQIPFDDVDMGGVVHNSKYLLFFERSRVGYFKQAGINFIPPPDDLFFVVRRHEIEYLRPLVFDDKIICEARVSEVRNSSFIFKYRILKEELLVATGMTVVVNVLPPLFNTNPLPDSFKEKITAFEQMARV